MYRILSGTDDWLGKFAIDSSGEITVSDTLDAEITMMYTLFVEAQDTRTQIIRLVNWHTYLVPNDTLNVIYTLFVKAQGHTDTNQVSELTHLLSTKLHTGLLRSQYTVYWGTRDMGTNYQVGELTRLLTPIWRTVVEAFFIWSSLLKYRSIQTVDQKQPRSFEEETYHIWGNVKEIISTHIWGEKVRLCDGSCLTLKITYIDMTCFI